MPAHNDYGQGRPAGPSPVGRERAGHERHLITDGNGTRLPVVLTGSNRDGVTQLPALVDAAKPSATRSADRTADQSRSRHTSATPVTASWSAPEASCPSPHVHSASGATGGTPDPGSIALLLCWMISWT
jgi:hypothetical protein